MTTAATTILAELRAQLDRHYPDWRAGELTVAGAGVQFLVCRAETTPFGSVAIRTPWTRTLDNDNDGILETRRLLVQEAAVGEHARAHGVPAPAVHATHLGDDGFDFLATGFATGDGSPPDPHAFGRLMRAIHDLPAPTLPLIEGGDLAPHERVAARLAERAAAFARLTGTALPVPPREAIVGMLAPRAAARALLHMDARPANFFTRGGAIVAIVDWGNALLGDPALELARIAEIGGLDDGFLAGYGDDPLAALPPPLEDIYRLDTAVMLALVFLAEAPDPAAARLWIARARALADGL